MRKCLFTILLTSFAFISAFAQYEDIYWKLKGEEKFAYASGGTAYFYNGPISEGSSFSASYTIKGDTVIFGPITELSCTGNGSYKMVLDNELLTYKKVTDACLLRSFVVDNTVWEKYNDPLSVEENVLAGQIKVYPNPASGTLNVQMPVANGQLSLFDAKGTQVLSKSLSALDNVISVASMSKGIYHAQILLNGQLIKNTTLVVE